MRKASDNKRRATTVAMAAGLLLMTLGSQAQAASAQFAGSTVIKTGATVSANGKATHNPHNQTITWKQFKVVIGDTKFNPSTGLPGVDSLCQVIGIIAGIVDEGTPF